MAGWLALLTCGGCLLFPLLLPKPGIEFPASLDNARMALS